MAALQEIPSIEDPTYREIYLQYSAETKKYKSLSMPLRSTRGVIGCRFSAFIYFCIVLLWNQFPKNKSGNRNIKGFSTKLMKVFDLKQIDAFEHEFLKDTLVGNKVTPDVVPIHTISDMDIDFPIIFLGITHTTPGGEKFFSHYFILRKEGENYFIISSYGSDLVSIQQYETPVSIKSMNQFINDMKEDEKSEECKLFMKKHFLSQTFAVPGEIMDDEAELSGPKSSMEAIDAEIGHYEGSGMEVVYIPGMKGYIEELIEKIKGGKRTKRKYKRRTRKIKPFLKC
jgi:hypothetical protein